MRTINHIAVVSVLALGSSGAAFAQTPSGGDIYVGGQAAFLVFDDSEQDDVDFDDAELIGLLARGGMYVNEHLSVEGRAGIGVGDDTVTVRPVGGGPDVDTDIELDYLVGGYLRGHLGLEDILSFYGVVGYTSAQISIENEFVSESETESGGSVGFGVDVYLGDSTILNFEFMSYYSDMNALNIGAVYRF
ncbi:porin family protein [Halorhodospira halochloris]|uniref:porin family protein n=1 Tax=Halorhodospira halochloris TaxID=1052 RepID=UPI001EE8205D|nr:porin family protein [Halorhodospira halochloris]MCG5531422.1 porin family protein [Halorhodospira halochloris]